VNTTCRQLVNRFVTTCLQFCITTFAFLRVKITHVKTPNLSTRCVRKRLVASFSTTCNNAVFYQVATRLSCITCYQLVESRDDNKLLEQLVTSLLSSTTL
jgi:hypothetical protein